MPHFDFEVSPQGVRIFRALFLGPSGSGKTTIAGRFIQLVNWPKPNIRVVSPPNKPTLSRILGVPHLSLAIRDYDAQERTFSEIFSTVCLPYDRGGMDIGLVLDDADFYFSQAGRTYGVTALSELVKLGREAGLSQIFIAQGSSAISKDLVSNSNIVFFGQTSEPNLLDYARRYMRSLPNAEEIISQLPRHVFLVWMPGANPQFQGFAKVVNGEIEWRNLPGTEDGASETGDLPGPTSDDDPEALSPGRSVSGEDAIVVSAIPTSPGTVPNTTRNI